jgi:predicted nucleotidyltransferase/predicted transcriptional regulator with HTH domain
MRISNESLFQKLFGSKVKRKVLQFLYNSSSPSSEREISRVIHVSHTAVNKVMKELLDINAVECFSVGKALVWGINKESFTYPHIEYLLKVLNITPLDFIRVEIAMALGKGIGRIGQGMPSRIIAAYIFGSVAKGTSRADSDIDVLIIVESGHHKDELAHELQESVGNDISVKVGNFVSFNIYSKKEVESNSPSWLKKATESGIKVYG